MFSEQQLKAEIIKEAKILRIPSGTATELASTVARRVAAWVKRRGTVTSADINRQTARELKKYHADLAYVYENRGKII